MDSEEPKHAVNEARSPALDLVPQPGRRVLYAFPKSLYQVSACFYYPVCKRIYRLNYARDYLRYGLDDFDNDGRKVLDKGDEELYARLDYQRDIVDKGINYAADNVRYCVDYRNDYFGKRADKGDEQLYARLDDLGGSLRAQP